MSNSHRSGTNASILLVSSPSRLLHTQNLINNGTSSSGGGGPSWNKGISTVDDMIKEMKMDLAPITGIAPTPRNEFIFNLNEVPKHKVGLLWIILAFSVLTGVVVESSPPPTNTQTWRLIDSPFFFFFSLPLAVHGTGAVVQRATNHQQQQQ